MNEDRHFYLYAKGHYKKTNIIDDLVTIYSKIYGGDLIDETEKLKYISGILVNLVKHHMFKYDNTFFEFIAEISPENSYRTGYYHKLNKFLLEKNENLEEYNFDKAVIYKCNSILLLTKVIDIPFELGEPDENILPLNNSWQIINNLIY